MVKAAFHTLGCKVNQYETQKLMEGFLSRGFDVVGFTDRADVYIINSCTVTHTADSKSRQAARAAARRNPGAIVVLTGCYAENSPETAGQVEGISLVVGNAGKDSIVEQVVARLSDDQVAALSPGRFASAPPGRTRATIKIQDGCDQYCSYCAVPYARPVMYSRPSEEIRREMAGLASRGYKEIVLTGIRLGRYLDADGTDLTDIVSIAAGMTGIERVRLSSVELTDIPEGLLDLMVEDRRVCRHLHIPLQSGDAGVLERMNRPYSPDQFATFVESSRSRVPGLAVTTDIMVGFPGETAAEFDSSRGFVEEIRFSRAHVFRYSARPGTAASKLPDDVSSAEKERRSRSLISLAERHSGDFARGLVGKVTPVLVEGKKAKDGLLSGFTDNYVRVEFHAGRDLIGEIVDVEVTRVLGSRAFGTIKLPAGAV